MAADLGLEAWGIDKSSKAIKLAREKAAARGLAVDFRVWDALDLQSLGERFDTAVDSGLFHLFERVERERFVESLRGTIASGGRYIMLCFSEDVRLGIGPLNISAEEIRSSFGDGWEIESIEPATMELNFTPVGISAWLSIIALQ